MKENLLPKGISVKAFIIRGGKFFTTEILSTTTYANTALKRIDFGESAV